jgi:hypothetical protein
MHFLIPKELTDIISKDNITVISTGYITKYKRTPDTFLLNKENTGFWNYKSFHEFLFGSESPTKVSGDYLKQKHLDLDDKFVFVSYQMPNGEKVIDTFKISKYILRPWQEVFPEIKD